MPSGWIYKSDDDFQYIGPKEWSKPEFWQKYYDEHAPNIMAAYRDCIKRMIEELEYGGKPDKGRPLEKDEYPCS